MSRLKLHFTLLGISLLLVACAKVSPMVSPASPTAAAIAAATGGKERAYLFAVTEESPPTTPLVDGRGTTIAFDTVGSDLGSNYDSVGGTFSVPRPNDYRFHAIVNWPGSMSQAEPNAVCELALWVDGTDRPLTSATGGYVKGQPCTAQISVRRSLKANDIVRLTAGVSATNLNLTKFEYVFGYLSITEEN